MSVPIAGILLDPYGEVASFAEIKFITVQGAGEVMTTAPAVYKTSADGAYSIDVQFGVFIVQMRYNQSNGKFQQVQKVIVNSNTVATTLGELLLNNEPLTPPEIAYVEQLVAEAKEYRDESEAFSIASEASAQNSATSAAESAQSAIDAANSAALIAPIPLNGGVWASGQEYEFYNQYMIYNGEAYSPLPATVLPYTVGAAPDLGFVYQIKLNDHSLLANRNSVGAHDGIYSRSFNTVADLENGISSDGTVIDMTQVVGVKVFWRGYYAESDGGSNWGIVKTGAHTDDGGSIFSIDASTYVEANLKGKKISGLKFGMIRDVDASGTRTGTDNHPMLLTHVSYVASQDDGSTAYYPDGKYYLSQGLNFDDVPLNNSDGTDFKRALNFTGENQYRTEFWLATGQTYHFKESFNPAGNTYRKINFSNFRCINSDLGDISVPSQPKYSEGGFQMFNNPHSSYKNLDFFYIKTGMHLRAAFFSTIKGFNSTRISHTGIFIDGDDGVGGFGFADYVTMKNITANMKAIYAGELQAGVRIRGSSDCSITNLDYEFSQAASVLCEGTSNTKVNNMHIEGASVSQPILLLPLTGWEDNIEQWNTAFCLDGSTILSSTINAIISVRPGVSGVSARNCSTKTRSGDEALDGIFLIQSSSVPNAQDAMHLLGGFQVWDNNLTFSELNYLNLTTQNLTSFRWGGNTVIERGTNQSFYGATLRQGDTYMLPQDNVAYKVKTSGTYGRTVTITGTTVAGSRFVAVDDATEVDVNTFMQFGTEVRQVTAVDRGLSIVECGSAFTTNQAGVAVSYATPTLLPIF